MDSSTVYELIGYVASTLVVISITQKSILRLRLIGLMGSATFLTYGILIGAFPIVAVNLAAATIHLWFLRKLIFHKDEVFSILHVSAESRYLGNFLDFYADDITSRFHPGFVYEPRPDQITAFVLRDVVPAGLFIGRRHDDGSVEVIVDYAIPQYRDFKMAPFLYSDESGLFTDRRCTSLWSDVGSEVQADYLTRVGFSPAAVANAPHRYVFELESSTDRASS